VIAIGLMSGTSLDGIDAAAVRIVPSRGGYALELLASRTVPFEPELEARVRAALPPNEPSPRAVAELDAALGDAFGRAAASVAENHDVGYVASHGLTLYHDGSAALTVQIGDPFVIREHTGATVASDFRRADCAAGGHGAPLVPYVDALLFAHPERFRVALNLGGIANATWLPAGATPDGAVAWDIGPANMLLDGFVRRRSDGRETYDRDGVRAARGRPDEALIAAMLADPYFALAPPKSTGREAFGEGFLDRHAAELERVSTDDGCASLLAVTVRAIGAAVVAGTPDDAELIVAGGGARNVALLEGLRVAVAPRAVTTSDVYGIDADAKEAIAFAVLGYELLRGRPAGLPKVTGARAPVLLGAIAPRDLDGLLERVRREVRLAVAATRTP
jgi:anhydro-N-acetylmuramic acid kinase